MSILFITSCSKNKLPNGMLINEISHCAIPNNEVIRIRSEIRRRVLCRELQGDLRNAVAGPDFGGREAGKYLPAYKRYAPGTFMTSLSRALGPGDECLDIWLNDNSLYFISGLYGIVEAREPIQNYDVRLENTVDYWRGDLLTRILMLAAKKAQTQTILNCSANYEYSRMIKWNIIEQDCEVLHAIGEKFEFGQIRSAAGELAANIGNPSLRAHICRGEVIYLTDADIHFVPTEKFYQTENSAVQLTRLRKERVGVISLDEREFAAFNDAIGQSLNRHFEFFRISNREQLLAAKRSGCSQCICHITTIKHKEYQIIFGKQNIEQAIKDAGLKCVIIKNGYSKLRLQLSA